MLDLKILKQKNVERWNRAKIVPALLSQVERASKKLLAAKDRYEMVEVKTNMPWWIIAVIHWRECTADFRRSLAQGDSWRIESVHIPKGRGPFSSWEEAAIDALTKCPPFIARNEDWSIENALTVLEKYNGLGYAKHNMPSPYLWAMTNQYLRGKYVSDGIYDPTTVDKQIGCAAILKTFDLNLKGV